MDAQSYFNAIRAKLPFGNYFPGNSQGSTSYGPVSLTGAAAKVEGWANSSWSGFTSTAKAIVTYPYNVVHGAYDEVKDAAHRAGEFVDKAQAATSQAATGFVSWTKWLVVGLIAVAVVYALATVSPLIPRGRR